MKKRGAKKSSKKAESTERSYPATNSSQNILPAKDMQVPTKLSSTNW